MVVVLRLDVNLCSLIGRLVDSTATSVDFTNGRLGMGVVKKNKVISSNG